MVSLWCSYLVCLCCTLADDLYLIYIGSSWVNIYTTYFLSIAGVTEAFSYSIMVTCMGLIGVFASFFIVRHMDRRAIVMIGVGACGLCQLAFAVAWTAAPASQAAAKCVIAFICIFTFFYVAYGTSINPLRANMASQHGFLLTLFL